MTKTDDTGVKVHYICQTYVETRAGRGGQAGLKIEKQIEYSTAQEAQSRAEREVRSGNCAGADAYMVIEDENSGEVGEPSFLARVGSVPDADGY